MQNHRCVLSVILGAAVFTLSSSALNAQTTKPAGGTISKDTAPATTLSINAQLNRRVAIAKYDDNALGDVLDALRDQMQANIEVDWKELETVDVTKETPITVNMKQVKTGKVLKSILESAAPGKLIFYVDQNILHITTIAKADTIMITTVHDVRDLLVTIPDFEGPNMDLTTQGNSQNSNNRAGGNRGGGNSNGIFGNNNNSNRDSEKEKTRDQRAQDLIDLIQTTIRPEVWSINGGSATIKYFNGTLIITAPVTLSNEL